MSDHMGTNDPEWLEFLKAFEENMRAYEEEYGQVSHCQSAALWFLPYVHIYLSNVGWVHCGLK